MKRKMTAKGFGVKGLFFNGPLSARNRTAPLRARLRRSGQPRAEARGSDTEVRLHSGPLLFFGIIGAHRSLAAGGWAPTRRGRRAHRLAGTWRCRRRHDVAGYLYGIAGECALKQIMRESGIRPGKNQHDDPYHAHFPGLKTLLRDRIWGRRAGDLRKFAEDHGLMNVWEIAMRYAPGKDIALRLVDRWKEHAHRLVQAMEGS